MNILKQIYKGGTLALLIAVTACTTEQFTEEAIAPGTTPISPMGVLTRSGDTNTDVLKDYTNLYLSALINNGSADIAYFTNKELTVGDITTNRNYKLNTDVYYPVGDKEIKLYAHTGEQINGKIKLVSGMAKADNDILISNTKTDGTEGAGTVGTSNNNVSLLTFSHAMTKVEVAFDIDSDVQETKPSSIELTFSDDKVVKEGQYELAKAFDDEAVTTPNKEDYILKKGINYLVANGVTLSGNQLIKSLKIDDYEATKEDCAALTMPQADLSGTKNDFILKPGLAYKLTLKIKRLKVTGITFEKVDWKVIELGSENSSYIPAKLNMTLGDYNQTADKDTITKVVLHTSDNKQYVGNIIYDNNSNPIGQFVSLPAAGTPLPTVDLYTSQGLLIAGVTATNYAVANSTTDRDITVSLSAGGMKMKNANANSATNPYLVETPLQFMNLAKETTGTYFQQENDLDLESLNVAFTPIESFNGTYDGNGKRILNATFSGNGLFTTNSGTIKNIRIASGKITATGTHAGSICGTNESAGTVVACINEAQIHGTATHAGGICGKNSGTITACLNTGDVFTGSSYSGGICGENTNTAAGTITACINVGMMNRANGEMAGICGTTTGASVLKTCYWLTGTAKKYSGNDVSVDDTEVAVHGYTPAEADDVADLSPQKLREDRGAEEASTTSVLLSTACNSTDYKFTYEVKANGCVWPMPIKKQSNP